MPRSVQTPALDPATAYLLNEEVQRVAKVEGVKRDRGLASLFVAIHVTDADDCRMLLDMLGLLDEPEGYLVDPVPHDCSPRKGARRQWE